MDQQTNSILAAPKPETKQPKDERRRRGCSGGLIVLVIFSLLIGSAGFAIGIITLLTPKNQPVATTSSAGYYTGGNAVEFKEDSVAGIAQKVTPAVVSIIGETRTTSTYSWLYGGGSSTSQSAGTGMLVSSDGYIITNKHVVEGVTKLSVVTDTGDTYDDVEVVGTDPLNDVAYLKIKGAKDLPTVTLGDSKTLGVGQPVLAIGNALGAYQNTVTQGIVSGLGRSLTATDANGGNSETLTDMIQTDAAINPGNSGGPLVNAAGEVIGINTAVSTSANGLGFAIPISATKGMLATIMDGKEASRSYIGVVYLNVTAEVAKKYELPVSHGAYVYNTNRDSSAVAEGGPADKAGIKTGDIITKVGEVEVGRAGTISTLIGEYKAGDTVTFTIRRGDETKTVNVTLGSYSKSNL